jgi:Holliday junction resolvase
MITEERISDLETALARFMEQSSVILAAIHEDIAEIRASNARTDRRLLEIQQQAEKDRQQAEKDRKDFNKRLAGLSDSMGTLIEDMVAPCGFQLARSIFGTEEAETCAVRIRSKHPIRRGESMELDLVAVGPTKLLAIEVKRRPNAEKIAEYREKLARVPEFFPEWANKTVIAAVASVYWEASAIAFLNRQKVYGIALGDEVMEVVNLGQF